MNRKPTSGRPARTSQRPASEAFEREPQVRGRSTSGRTARVLRQAMQEVLGEREMLSLLSAAGLSDGTSAHPSTGKQLARSCEEGILVAAAGGILMALETMHGRLAARGIALRIGQACFRYGLREFGQPAGAYRPGFRLLPLRSRMRAGLQGLSDLLSERGGQQVRLEEQNGSFFLCVDHCPLCGQQPSDEPVCYLTVGLLEEALYWLSGGKTFRVEETACFARGDSACRFAIDRMPILE